MATASSMTFRYGRSNFHQIRMQNRFFADNTNVIRDIENHEADHMLLCRPPRFGKSLLLSTMKWYYDERTTDDQFQALFSELDIGKNKTPCARCYKVLQLSLTADVVANDSDQMIRTKLADTIKGALKDFRNHYNLSFELIHDNACASLKEMCVALAQMERKGEQQRLLILLDECDRISNMLLDTGCTDVLLREKLAPIKNVFMALKDLATQVEISELRTFTVGISPLPLAQMSVWNMFDDISLNPKFARALGLSEQQVASAIELLGLTRESLVHQNMLALLRHYFNGYCFAGTDTALFNPQLIVRFCQLYQENEAFKQLVKDPEWKTWDDRHFKAFMRKSDPNVLPAESLFRILEQLPVCTTVLLQALGSSEPADAEASTAGVSVTVNAIRNGLMPSEMKTSREQLLWFMYFHGLVTSCSPERAVSSEPSGSGEGDATASDTLTLNWRLLLTESYRLRLPNRLVRDDHLAELKRRLGQQNLLERVLINTNAEQLHELLWWMVSQQQTEHGDDFHECALQAELEAALRFMSSTTELPDGNFPTVLAGCKLTPGKKDEKECDVIIVCDQPAKVLHIELKRIKPHQVNMGDGSRHCVKDVAEWTKAMTEEQLLKVEKLTPRKGETGDGCPSVQSVLNLAFEQLKDRLPLVRSKWPLHEVHQFGVVQVGWRLVVLKAQQSLMVLL